MSPQSSNIPAPPRDAIVDAVSHRFDESQAQTQVRAAAVRAQIQALAPQDALEEMLMGQVVALHEVFAEITHDLLNGVVDPMRLKGQASLVTIARVTQGHVDRLKRMAKQPARAEIPAARIAQPGPVRTPAPGVMPAPARNVVPARDAEPTRNAMTEDRALAAIAPGYERPRLPDSPLDEPFVEWVAEPPAEAVRAARVETPPHAARRAGGPESNAPNRVQEMVADLIRQQLAAAARTRPARVPEDAVGD